MIKIQILPSNDRDLFIFGESESDHGGKEKQLEGQKNMRDIFIIEDF